MSIIKHTLVLVLLATLLACSTTVHADDDYNPPDNYVDLLFSGDQTDWPNWKHALVRLGILDKFKTQCEAGELPWIRPSYLSRDFNRVSTLSLVSGSSIVIDPFPMSEFAYPEPANWDIVTMGLTDDYLMQFGVYCMFVSPTIDVLLTCPTPRSATPCNPPTTITLEPGFTWLLIDGRPWFVLRVLHCTNSLPRQDKHLCRWRSNGSSSITKFYYHVIHTKRITRVVEQPYWKVT